MEIVNNSGKSSDDHGGKELEFIKAMAEGFEDSRLSFIHVIMRDINVPISVRSSDLELITANKSYMEMFGINRLGCNLHEHFNHHIFAESAPIDRESGQAEAWWFEQHRLAAIGSGSILIRVRTHSGDVIGMEWSCIKIDPWVVCHLKPNMRGRLRVVS